MIRLTSTPRLGTKNKEAPRHFWQKFKALGKMLRVPHNKILHNFPLQHCEATQSSCDINFSLKLRRQNKRTSERRKKQVEHEDAAPWSRQPSMAGSQKVLDQVLESENLTLTRDIMLGCLAPTPRRFMSKVLISYGRGSSTVSVELLV